MRVRGSVNDMSHLEMQIRELLERYDSKSVVQILERVLRPELLKECPRAIPCLEDAYRFLKAKNEAKID